MAGSSSLTPKPVSPSRQPKRFTLDEANKTLPLVRRIVGDIVKLQTRISDLEAALGAAGSKSQSPMRTELDRANERMGGYEHELLHVGCQLKDREMGLVDFIGRYRDRDICLCWKLGEEKIEYWHEIAAGYAGRQPVGLLNA
ncbi:MAG TPA: DUF2203 domain-containing protein [Tepidisphaeraceae bacterium]|nr:DUF2203 domain-containing protein [Tepidisphaeraceae bacterium]